MMHRKRTSRFRLGLSALALGQLILGPAVAHESIGIVGRDIGSASKNARIGPSASSNAAV